MQKKSLLAVGSLAFDSIRTPSAYAEKVLGGSANYFSLSSSFFTPVQVVGVVGEDFPESQLELLETRGVDTRGIQRAKGETFHWAGEYNSDFNEAKTLSTQLNVFEHFQPKIPQEYQDAEYVFLGNIAPELQMSVLNQVKKPKLIAMDSMNFWITGRRNELLGVLPRIDLLTINEGEARLLGENQNVVMAAENILRMGPKALVVKRGEYGAFLFHNGEVFSAPAYPTKRVVDPTGAGDTFAGALMGHLTRTSSGLEKTALRQSVIHGAVMASFTVEEFGFRRLLEITPAQIEERHSQLLKMMSV